MSATDSRAILAPAFERNWSKTLLVTADGRDVSYEAFWQNSERMALRLAGLGARRGSRLLVRAENSPHVIELYMASAMAGYVACPIDPALPQPRVAAVEAQLRPDLLVDDAQLAHLVRSPVPGGEPLQWGSGEDDFLIVCSSGSTEEPKAIVHTVRSMIDSASSFSQLARMDGDTIVYHHFPMFYMAGIFNLFLSPLVAGATIVVGPQFSKQEMLRFWEVPLRHGVNHLTLTPTMARALCAVYRRDDRVAEHLSKYQAAIATGSPLYPSIGEGFYTTFHMPLRSCYGVTEVGGTITFQDWDDALALQSMGRWAAATQIRAGVEGAPGEILVKTPFMARGYLRTGAVVSPYDADGFFHTGDLGYVQDGRLHFTGREGDLVKKGGEFVSTQLIEDLALRSRLIADAAVVAIPDEFWGALIVLFYVPHADAGEQDILAEFGSLFSEGLREIERPDKIIPVPWMPKTAIGKIVKRELVSKYTLRPGAAV